MDKQSVEKMLQPLLDLFNQDTFLLPCGHHITFSQMLADSTAYCDSELQMIVCPECGYLEAVQWDHPIFGCVDTEKEYKNELLLKASNF